MVFERELNEAKKEMNIAFEQMNNAADDYVDAAVMRYNAAFETYRALLRESKENGIKTIEMETAEQKIKEKEEKRGFLGRVVGIFM
jgi:pimeloyl-CoA synthetase